MKIFFTDEVKSRHSQMKETYSKKRRLILKIIMKGSPLNRKKMTQEEKMQEKRMVDRVKIFHNQDGVSENT